jgi:acetyl-CoA synthetase
MDGAGPDRIPRFGTRFFALYAAWFNLSGISNLISRYGAERGVADGLLPRYNLGVACSDAPAARVGDRPALIHERNGTVETIGFAGLARASSGVAARLAEAGIAPGDRVGVLASAGIATAIGHLAVMKAGAVTVPLVPLLGDEAIAYRLQDADVSLVLVASSELDRFRRIGAAAPALELESVIEEAREPGLLHPTGARDPAVIIYSSGTTGKPKGAVQPHGIVLGRHAPVAMIHGPFVADDIFWSPVDWMWIGSFIDAVLAPLSYGCTVLAYDRRRFDAAACVEALKAHGVTKAFIPPTALRMLMDVPTSAWGGHRLTSVHSGGESLTALAAAWAEETLGLTIDEIYGMTEASFTIGSAHRYYPPVPGSMGIPYPGQPVRLVRDDGTEAAVGEDGEIMIGPSSPSLFVGYWGRPAETEAQFRDGWWGTGDLALRDEAGYLHYRGRKDHLIMSAGHRLGPAEIESALARHSAVRAVVVGGAPDPERGQIVKAVVELVDEARDLARDKITVELQDIVRHAVGRHAYPRVIEFVDELPRTATGKIRRDVLSAGDTV